jgi:hypothetical protein
MIPDQNPMFPDLALARRRQRAFEQVPAHQSAELKVRVRSFRRFPQ